MDVTILGSQAPALLNQTVDKAGGRTVQATPPASPARQTEAQPPESTRVSLSQEGRSRLAAEQQAQATQPPPVQPQVSTPQQTNAPGPISGPTQAGSTTTTVSAAANAPAQPIPQTSTQGTQANTVTGTRGNQPATQTPAPQDNAAIRINQQQAEQVQQENRARQNNEAISRQDVSPVVAQGSASVNQGVLTA